VTAAPPRWCTAQLTVDAATAIAQFREERMGEPLEEYLERFDEVRAKMEDLLELTVDLSKLRDMAVDVLTDPGLFEAVRYLAGPPISKDDLSVLSDATLSPASVKRNPRPRPQSVPVGRRGS
jgi:hypothetical protein